MQELTLETMLAVFEEIFGRDLDYRSLCLCVDP
jgi:hypothetical protein